MINFLIKRNFGLKYLRWALINGIFLEVELAAGHGSHQEHDMKSILKLPISTFGVGWVCSSGKRLYKFAHITYPPEWQAQNYGLYVTNLFKYLNARSWTSLAFFRSRHTDHFYWTHYNLLKINALITLTPVNWSVMQRKSND